MSTTRPPRDAGPYEPMNRRSFLSRGLATAGLATSWPAICRAAVESAIPAKRLRVAAVVTSFYYRSHAHVILENFLEPYLFNGQLIQPPMDVVALYADQLPDKDMARQVSQDYRIPLFKTIDEALCVGGRELAVDAVLSIGEHGNYPLNELGQREYPRKRFFDEIVAVMERSGRFVPLFNDKHLSFRWDWAQEMYDTARRLKIPFMAGSSVPLAQRIPPLEIPAKTRITEAVAVHGGPAESYDFHGLEVLQSFVEGRAGNESGIRRVQMLTGDALWKAAEEGRWSLPLAEAAMAAEAGHRPIPLREMIEDPPHAILLDYQDGLKGAVVKIGTSAIRWNFACRIAGREEPLATHMYAGPWNNRGLFRALAHAIQDFFMTGVPGAPIERTLLTTGALAAAMRSLHAEGKPIETPELQFAYASRDFSPLREMGGTWKIVTDAAPQPPGLKRDVIPTPQEM